MVSSNKTKSNEASSEDTKANLLSHLQNSIGSFVTITQSTCKIDTIMGVEIEDCQIKCNESRIEIYTNNGGLEILIDSSCTIEEVPECEGIEYLIKYSDTTLGILFNNLYI